MQASVGLIYVFNFTILNWNLFFLLLYHKLI